ncbi:alpha/beta fold hydrolase [Zavarzinia compransoris]|uniref:Alpha/beta hydrolase n=1 Tax=Zavarzinia compransoris TaxID=1264899 RepID=A0A317ECK2_9PROT|nr:alpha/beta fold hydrolase [Zavarzinia compransoris]PWR23093.1 alpha/beta hydrolase [Zavarzinia compransoris]TDP46358.1 alpha-beta hydrolase superfamily lysophospholipase [Zavarzinia compransoris]
MFAVPFRCLLPIVLAAALGGCGATVTGLGPRVAAPSLSAAGFTAADGTVLPVQSWLPGGGGPAAALLLGLHGFNDYAGAFAPAAPFWAHHGIATVAYDQRGFGRSATRLLWPGTEALVEDAAAMVRLLAARHPGRPLFLMGESMGGAVALLTLARHPDLPVAGVVLLAPAVWGAEDVPFPGLLLLDIASFVMPWNRMTPPEGMRIRPTDNEDEIKAMRADPLMLKETRTDSVQGLMALMAAAAAAGVPRDRPVLLLYGLQDRIVPFEAVARLAARARAESPLFRERWYDRGYHLLLRDRRGPRVWRDILAFVRAPARFDGDAARF